MYKAISSIFSSLIVTLIILSLSVPLITFFYKEYHNISITQNVEFNKLNMLTMTKLSLIKLNQSSSGTFLYNYGQISIHIKEVIVGNETFRVDYILSSGQIISLSKLIGDATIGNNTVLIVANGIEIVFN